MMKTYKYFKKTIGNIKVTFDERSGYIYISEVDEVYNVGFKRISLETDQLDNVISLLSELKEGLK